MDIDQLEAFLSIAKTGNFTRTARVLHMAQSTVSAKILALEATLGVPLFYRTNRWVMLTTEGAAFRPYAERMVSLARESRLALQSDGKFSSSMVIGGHGSIWAYGLLGYLQEFRRNHHEVSVFLHTGSASTIIQHIRDGIIDIGVVYHPPNHPRFSVLPLYDDELILVGKQPPDHPVTVEDLRSHPYIHIDWGSPFSEWFEKLIGPGHVPSLKLDHASVMLRILLDGCGFGFMLRSIVEDYLDSGQLVAFPHALSDATPTRPVKVVYLSSRQQEPAIQLGLELLHLPSSPL